MDTGDTINIPNTGEIPVEPLANLGDDTTGDKEIRLDLNVNDILPPDQRRRRIDPKINPPEKYNLHSTDKYVNVINTIVVLTQLGMKTRIKAFGQQGLDAVMKEMKQFHDRKVVRPIHPNNITDDIWAQALGYLMFLKYKRGQ